MLSETHETGEALRLRGAFPPKLGLHTVGSRTHTRGGGVAILYRKDRFKFHSAVENKVEVTSHTSFRATITIGGAYVTTSTSIMASE